MDTCLVFNLAVHQPLSDYSFFDIGKAKDHFKAGTHAAQQVSYLKIILDKADQGLHTNLCISGVFIEALQSEEVLFNRLKQAVAKKQLTLVGGTYHYSLAALFSPSLFKDQLHTHRALLHNLFKIEPQVFLHPSALYSNKMAVEIKNAGYSAAITESLNWYLGTQSPQQLFLSADESLRLLLHADHTSGESAGIKTVCIDAAQTEVDIAKQIDDLALQHTLISVEAAIEKYPATQKYRVPMPIGNAVARSYNYFTENAMQRDIMEKINFLLERAAIKKEDWNDKLAPFTCLFYFKQMDNKHAGQNPYDSYISFMNILSDLELSKK